MSEKTDLSCDESVIVQLQKELIEANCALYHLRQAIASVEICGTPIHQLSFDISKHFNAEISFVKEVQASAVLDFCKELKRDVQEKMPDDVSNDLLVGWKSGVMDARDCGLKYADAIVFEHQSNFVKERTS